MVEAWRQAVMIAYPSANRWPTLRQPERSVGLAFTYARRSLLPALGIPESQLADESAASMPCRGG